jgi:hypothetical protein
MGGSGALLVGGLGPIGRPPVGTRVDASLDGVSQTSLLLLFAGASFGTSRRSLDLAE